MWPGYVSAVDVFEGGLYLQVDVASRVLRTETILEILVNLGRKGASNLKGEAEKALLGTSVVTKYNNKNYKIDGIDFEDSPRGTFTNQRGETISFIEYYERQYGIKIKDEKQPMLINRPKIKGLAEGQTERIIKLVPELCFPTGLTGKKTFTASILEVISLIIFIFLDAQRADFKIMKELGTYTRLTPPQRQVVFISLLVH